MEEKLLDSEERYRLLFENAGTGIGYYDPKGNILAFNSMALKYISGSLKDFLCKNVLEIYGQEMGIRYPYP